MIYYPFGDLAGAILLIAISIVVWRLFKKTFNVTVTRIRFYELYKLYKLEVELKERKISFEDLLKLEARFESKKDKGYKTDLYDIDSAWENDKKKFEKNPSEKKV